MGPELRELWRRFSELPLTSLEKAAVYGAIKDRSLEELQEMLPDFLDNETVASFLRRMLLVPGGEEFRSHVAYWGSNSLLSIAPSSFKNSTCKLVQEDWQGPAFLNFRPPAARPLIPLQLAHPVFGTFLDIFHGAPGAVQPQVEDYMFFLNLAAACCSFWDAEVSGYRPTVWKLWRDYTDLDLQQELHTGNTKRRQNSATATEIGYALDTRVLIALFEAKLGMCGTGTDPGMQALQNYRLYWSKVGDERRFSGSCYPALLVEHVGPFVRVSAVANLNTVSCQPLTPFINLLQIQEQDVRAAEQGVRLCLAVKKTLYGLVNFYEETSMALPRLLIESGIPYPLQSLSSTAERWNNKLVYLVTEANTVMVVKYVQGEYGEAVHRAWSAAGYAPQLLEPVRRLPGGWLEVRMECLGPEWKLLQSREDADALRPQVLRVLADAHQIPVGESFGVHGDMRDMNVMVKDTGEVKFIDFDWSREEGRGSYPGFMNHVGIRWPDGARPGLPMLREHDRRLLSTEQRLQCVYTES